MLSPVSPTIGYEAGGRSQVLPPASLYTLPALPFLRLRVALQALEPVRLPPFRGSLLRGAFGHALRRAVCTMGPEQACAGCRLRFECAYARIFETPIEPGTEPPFLRGEKAGPHPYVFEAPDSSADLAAGDLLPFDLLLFGDAIGFQGRVLMALERMGAAGLGARRARFALARVEAFGPSRAPLFSNGAWVSSAMARGGPLPAAPLPGDGERVRLSFLTPLRLRRDKRIVPPRDPRDLIFQMLLRILGVTHFHTREPRIDWTFRPLLDAASALEAPEWRFRHVKLTRYSNRQGTSLDLDGYIGSAVLEGDLAPLAPLLRAAEEVHFGKGTVFGLGKVAIEAV